MLHSVQSFFYFSPKCLFSVRLDSLCLPRGRGRGLVCTRRFSFREFYNFLLFNFLIVIFLEPFFFPTTFTYSNDPHPYPRPTTHDPRQRITPSPGQPSRANKPSLAIPDQPSLTSVWQVLIKPSREGPHQTQSSHSRYTKSNKCLASPDQTQSRRSSSNPVKPVQINPV